MVICALRFAGRVRRWLFMTAHRPLFASHGRNSRFDPAGDHSFSTIHVGTDVHLGMRLTLNATRSTIRIGNKVLFGPGVTIRGGSHRTDLVGRFMFDVTESPRTS